MSFNHRLENNNINTLSTVQLSDAIHSMTQRAESIIAIIQGEFVGDSRDELNPELMFRALDSVRMEVADIRETVNKYYSYQREQENKEDR